MATISRQDLDKMLALLSLDILDAINAKYLNDTYIWGKARLLTYTPEALTEYAEAIYRYILPHFGLVTETLEEYIAKWLAPETAITEWLSSNEGRFVETLEDIASNPIIDPNVIREPEYDAYGLIEDFLQGDKCFYETLNDFLFSKKLRDQFIEDPRIIDLVNEIDAMRDRCNKKLADFIGQQLDYTEKTEKILNSDKIKKVSYRVLMPSTTYGTELKRLRKLVSNRLEFCSLRSSTIKLITTHKALIPVEDWNIVSQAFENKTITSKVRKLITASLKTINEAKNPDVVITSDPACADSIVETKENEKLITYLKRNTKEDFSPELDAVAINELFIGHFINQLGTAYSNIVPNKENPQDDDLLDSIFAEIDLLNLAQDKDMNFELLQSQQKATESWYSDYNNINKSLVACLQIALNNINPSTVLTDEILSHKAIVGMLAFSEQVKTLISARVIVLDYDILAQELQQQLRTHTSVYVDLAALPNIRTMSKEQIINAQEGTIEQVKLADTAFDITKNIQENISKLKPTLVLAEYEKVSLSDEEIESLVPVPDRTITELLALFVGKGTKPFMLDGSLIALKDNEYIKIVPEIDKDGYASYKFTPINGKALNWLIDKYAELLQATPNYTNLIGYYKNPGEEYFGIAPIYDYSDNDSENDEIDVTDVDTHFGNSTSINPLKHSETNITDDEGDDDYTVETFNSMLKSRMQSTQNHLSLSDFSKKLESQLYNYWDDNELFKCLRSTVKRVYKELETPYYVPYTKYYDPPYYISSHHLSAWVYFVEDYTANITNGDYQVDHIKRGKKYRSDNRPSNLRIVPADFNTGRTSRSIEVTYNGEPFVSLSAYCTKTAAGDYDYLLDLKESLQPGEVKEYKGRLYALGAEEQQLIVTDAPPKASGITYNGVTFDTPKAFADNVKIDYKSLHNALSSARKAGKSEFSRKFKNKKYTFYLDESGDIINII